MCNKVKRYFARLLLTSGPAQRPPPMQRLRVCNSQQCRICESAACHKDLQPLSTQQVCIVCECLHSNTCKRSERGKKKKLLRVSALDTQTHTHATVRFAPNLRVSAPAPFDACSWWPCAPACKQSFTVRPTEAEHLALPFCTILSQQAKFPQLQSVAKTRPRCTFIRERFHESRFLQRHFQPH